VLLVGGDVAGVRRQVDVVEAPVRHAQLGEELERGVDLGLGGGHRVALLPREAAGARAERVGAGVAEGVPVADREAQVVAHGLAADHLVGIVDLERQRVVRFRTFVGDRADAGEVPGGAAEGCAHPVGCVWGFVQRGCAQAYSGRIAARRAGTRAYRAASTSVGSACAGAGESDPPPWARLVAHRACSAAPNAAPSACSGTPTGRPNTAAIICRHTALWLPPPVRRMASKRMPASTKAS